jgi:hypothetical protein
MSITSKDFSALYTGEFYRKTLFEKGIGFSLVLNYPKNTPYYKDNRKIFIQIIINENNTLDYSINMTIEKDEDKKKTFIITEGLEYNKKIINFHSESGECCFNQEDNRVIYNSIEFTLDKFIDILILNHLENKHFFERAQNKIIDYILKFIFWLNDKKYTPPSARDAEETIDWAEFKSPSEELATITKPLEKDPFLGFFHLPKNIIFVVAILIWISYLIKPLEVSLSNPFLIAFIFLLLFTIELLYKNLKEEVEQLELLLKEKEHKKNWLIHLYNYRKVDTFILKIPK